MGLLTAAAYGALDRRIEDDGQDDFLFKVCDLVSSGESFDHVGKVMGVRPTVLKKWIEESTERIAELDRAKRCFADSLVYESLRIVRDASLEEVPLARLQSESYDKKAAKLSKIDWGQQQEININVGVSIVAALEEAQSRVLQGICERVGGASENGEE